MLRTGRRGFMIGSLCMLAACDRAPRTQMFANDTHPRDYPTVRAVEYFGDLIERRSNGRLSIKMFAGGQLGSERDTLEITAFGGLDINRVNIAPLNAIEPMTMILSLPFLFDSIEHSRRAFDGPPGQAILQSLTRHGLIGLCYYDSGARSFYNTYGPVRTPGDMRGRKYRVQNSDLYVGTVNALGADATPMALGEIYQGLVQGVIDGAENNWPTYQSERHFEVAPYYSETQHVMAPEVLLMSKIRWDKLSRADQEIIMESARESVPYMRRLWDARVVAARRAVLAAGAKVNEVDHKAFQDKTRPLWDRFVTTGRERDLVRQIQAMGGADA
ncbi:TRAP transporter substrate-binding protein [Stakelama saccharophila]|uniref:TRAP transporter substrate-binding protein n=1 Tax=Stakelama saccharophila TaxID=3075605 RepID=A0ABZ0BBZ9_9SPHN|nr:TRAP transporter substrate-binding protein [Stakelama sp. W311]WNO54813.1 TRAP transporter substrate-binding protein [Stakelama sp. W311]